MSEYYKKLSDTDIKNFGDEIEQLRVETKNSIGKIDAQYIRKINRFVRYFGVLGRVCLFLSFIPPFWFMGVVFLSLSKIIDNMELGHNVIHGQFDFMNDRNFNGKTFEWDIAATSENWRETHNFKHHTFTNVDGYDEDIGYGFIRIFAEQKWSKFHLLQPLYTFLFAFVFEWGVALQNVKFGDKEAGFLAMVKFNSETWKKMKWQVVKDYVVFPLLAGPNFLLVLAGNAVANVIRSLWTFLIIFCGHFTAKVQVFPADAINENSKGHWYLRQVQGSSNIRGSKLLHLMSGNLSHQIEHHLFPELPANRYADLAPKVEAICQKYGQTYNTGNIVVQFSQVIYRILRHSLPSTPKLS